MLLRRAGPLSWGRTARRVVRFQPATSSRLVAISFFQLMSRKVRKVAEDDRATRTSESRARVSPRITRSRVVWARCFDETIRRCAFASVARVLPSRASTM